MKSIIQYSMKKRFLLLSLIAFMMQCSALQLMGQGQDLTATWVAADLNYANGTVVTSPFNIGVYAQCQFAKATGSSAPAYYTNHVRLYAKNTVTISPLNGASISKVELTCKKNGGKAYCQFINPPIPSGTNWVDPVPASATDTVVACWEGALKNDLVLTMGNSGQRIVIMIEVTYSTPDNTVYQVIYYPNGGVGDSIVQTGTYNSTMTVMQNSFDRDEYVFDSWNTAADGSGATYTPGSTFTLLNDLSLYAQWTTSPDLFVDVLTPTNVNDAIGDTTGYIAWTLDLPNSQNRRITYQGKTLKDANYIQMTSSISGASAYSGIATTYTHNMKAKKVKVTWNGNTSNGSKLYVFGKDTPYSGTSDLYDQTHYGTLLDSIVKGTDTELDISALNGTYPYIGLRSSSGALYLTEIRIIWETLDTSVPTVRIEPNTVNLGNVVVNSPMSVNFTVSQANLTSAITLSTSPTTGVGTFSVNGTTVTTIAAGAAPTVVTWTYTPTTEGSFGTHVRATSGNAIGNLAIEATVLSSTAQTLNGSKAAFVANSANSSACINLANVEVIAQSGNYLYLQDAVAGLLVYGSGAPSFQTPCKFTSGYLQGTYTNYHGIIELQNFQFVDAVTTQDMQLTATVATVDQILTSPATYDSRYVELDNVNISSWALTGTNANLAFHDRFQTGYATKTAPNANDPFTVKGLVNGYYSSGTTNYQIDPIALADISTTVKAAGPGISPRGSSSQPSNATTVQISPATNTEAHYSLNGGSFLTITTWTYVNLSEPTTTLKAYGTRDFYANSDLDSSYYQLPSNTFTVKFSINGVINSNNNVLVTSELVANQTPSVTCLGDFGFAGWSTSESSTQTITLPYTVTASDTLYAVYAKGTDFVYRKVNSVAEFVDGEYIIFAESNDKYAIKNAASSNSPTAYSMTSLGISVNNNNELVGNDFSELTWNFTGTASDMQITSTANNTNHLYIIGNSSTGVRVGHTSSGTSWTITEDLNVNEQFNMMCNGRYMVVYNNQDWRSYTTLTNQNSYPRLTLYRKQAVINNNAPRYTRVFWNETATRNIALNGPSIIPSGYYLDMNNNNNMTNSTAANFLIEDGANFKVSYGNTGIAATVKKDIAGYVNDTVLTGWHLLSSPVGKISIPHDHAPAGLLSGNYDLYVFDQSQAREWRNYEAGSTIIFGAQGGVLYANRANTTIVFTGNLTATVQHDTLVYVANRPCSGWNIIGNPYMTNGYLNVEYIGQGEGTAITDYYYMKDVSENGKKFSKLIATSITNPVYPMEGVFVQAPSTGYRYWFVNSNRGQSVVQSEYFNIKLTGTDGEVVDEARVRFNEGSLMGKFDFGEGGSQLYIPQGGKKYAVVPTQRHGELPLSFKAANNGTFTLTFDLEEAEMDYLHLIDNKTGVDVDLLETPTYTFDATVDDYTTRFRLLFEANGALGNDNFAYYDGSAWVVTGCYDNATLQVVDMLGRVLSSQAVNGSTELNINQAQGVYVLRLINGNEIKSQKIVVR